MTRFERIVVALLSLQLLVSVLFVVGFFGLFVEQFIELNGDVSKIELEVFRRGASCSLTRSFHHAPSSILSTRIGWTCNALAMSRGRSPVAARRCTSRRRQC